MKTPPNIPEAVLKIVREGTAPKGKTFVTAATAMCFGAPEPFRKLTAALSGTNGAAMFNHIKETDYNAALEALCVLSLTASYALAEEDGTLQGVLVAKDAPTDMEFITEGPENFTRYMHIQEARKTLLHEIVSAYFHETGHAVAATHFGATPNINIRFDPVSTKEGMALTAGRFGCSAERDHKPDDAEQAVLSLAGVMFELLAPQHSAMAPLVNNLLADHDFWIKLLRTALETNERGDDATELTASAELAHKTLYGAAGDANGFFKQAPTRELQVAAIDRAAAILRPLMDKDGDGCETFADTTLAAINHFMTLDAINNDLRKVMARYSNVPTYGLYGGKEQREHAREVKQEAQAELAKEKGNE